MNNTLTENKDNKKDKEYSVTFDIQPLADEMGISKQKCAELLTDEIMKIIFTPVRF